MQSKLQFYHFQNEILNKFESEYERGDKKIHIVAPPGSGKTIMGIEMINRLIKKGVSGNVLILVPNTTLQFQWKEKIEKYFLEEKENIETLVSLDRNIIKKINILTYQAISQSDVGTDDFLEQILKLWYEDVKTDFKDYEDFLKYSEDLKERDIKQYGENIGNYKKKVKLTNTKDVLSDNVKTYLEQLKKEKVSTIVVDEAHHLTSFWSKVIYYIWQFLDNPYVVGLTATPPFDDSDFFVLDDDYTNLLGEVDYYVPTPAIVKAGRLAPYSDLVYFVKPGDELEKQMEKNDIILNKFLDENKDKIGSYLYDDISKNYDKLLKNSPALLLNYLKFIFNYCTDLDISNFAFSDDVFEKASLEDIAKSVGKYLGKKTDNEGVISIFYNLGYIWNRNNFYKFRTPIEMALIYSKSKINGVNKILEKEIENKQSNLRGAIITDFLDEGENNYINAKYILDEVNKTYPNLNTILVSGQGIWKYENNSLIELDTNILEVTKKLENSEINLIVGTRGILGEGWDCPKLNVLIDLTGVSAFMSVNQIRGRAIRLDIDNPKKVGNIYDIICLGEGYKANIDFERVEKKYENFYGIDTSGIVVKGINHIYPDFAHHLDNVEKINENMLKRSTLLEYFYDLWLIGQEFENKEIFGLNLEIKAFKKYFPFVKIRLWEYFKFNGLFKKEINENIEDLGKDNFYNEIIIRFVKNLLDTIVSTLIKFGDLPKGFKYQIKKSESGNFKIVSDYKDALVSKAFINHVKEIFSPVSTQRYMIDMFCLSQEGKELKEDILQLSLPNIVARNEEYREEIEYFFRDILARKVNGEVNFFHIIVLTFIFGISLGNGLGLGDIYLILIFIGSFVGLIFYFIYIYESPYDNYKYSIKLKTKKTNYIKFTYLNSSEINKKEYVGKEPFISGKIEKLWI